MKEYTIPHETQYDSPYDTTYGNEETSAFRRQCDNTMQAAGDQAAELIAGARQAFCRFAREKPETAALCCLGIGFVLGWKLKPW